MYSRQTADRLYEIAKEQDHDNPTKTINFLIDHYERTKGIMQLDGDTAPYKVEPQEKLYTFHVAADFNLFGETEKTYLGVESICNDKSKIEPYSCDSYKDMLQEVDKVKEALKDYSQLSNFRYELV